MQLNSNLSETVIQRWQIVKDSIHENLNSFTESVQQTTDNTQDYLENNWHTVEKITNSTSGVMQKAINTSVHDFLSQYPWIFKLLETLTWGINHPVRGVICLLFIIAIIWSVIKAIVRVIETASWSILKIPFILLQQLLKFLWIQFSKVRIFGIGNIKNNQLNNLEKVRLISTNLYPNKQQRLGEISRRLATIHDEQQALLQEAAKLMESERKNIIINDPNVEETSV
jgi:hypothetical protein